MRVFLLWLTGFLLAPAMAVAQQAEAPEVPELTVHVTPQEAITNRGYVQGQLVLNIQLLSRYPFEELSLTPPVIEGAHIVQLMRPRTRKISGYAGQGTLFETALAIIPAQAGVLRIPAVSAIGVVEPRKEEEVRFDLASEPFEIEISGIPAAYEADWWLVTPRVEIDESWSTPVEEIRVGEVVERRVSLRVWGISAERLPTLVHPITRGASVSLRGLDTRTETSPEGLIGHADYTWDFTIQHQQIVFVKPVGVDYWDPLEQSKKAVGVRGHRLEPLPADSEATAAALMQEAADVRDRTSSFAWGTALVLALPCIALLIALVSACLPTRADRRLRQACHPSATPKALYKALDVWVAESGLGAGDMTQRVPERGKLSDHLFARSHPTADVRRALCRQAFQWSRSARISAISGYAEKTSEKTCEI